MTYTIYYGATQIYPISFSLNSSLKSKKTAQLSISDRRHGELTTWEARVYQDLIYIYKDSTCIFIGYVDNVNSQNSVINLSCVDQLVELDWDIVVETDNNQFIKDTVYVATIPTSYQLKCKTNEDESPDWVYNTYGDKNLFVILSDKTSGSSSVEMCDYTSANTIYVNGLTADTYYGTNLENDDDTNYVTLTNITDGSYVDIKFVKHVVASTSNITDINVNFNIELDFDTYTAGIIKYEWYKNDGTFVENIGSFNMYPNGNQNLTIQYLKENIETSTYFSNSGAYWEAKLRITFIGTNWRENRIDHASCLVSYETTTFENQNRKLRLNSTNTLALWNDAEDDNYNLVNKGINVGDQVDIVMNFNDALNECNKSNIFLDVPIINKGISQSYANIIQSTAIQNILEEQKLEWFATYSEDYTYLKAIAEEDITDATITYESGSDEPSDAESITYEPNVYGSVRIKYANGITDKRYATTPPSDPRTKIINADWIVTKTGANEYGDKMAEYYSTPHRSIMVTWNKDMTNLPEVGTKYNIDFLKWNSVSKIYEPYTYEDQICRRVQITWSNDGSMTIVAYIGGGSTPENEKIGKEIGDLKKNNNIYQGVMNTKYKSSVTRWSQLDGKPSTFTPISHNNDYHSETYITISDAETIPYHKPTQFNLGSGEHWFHIGTLSGYGARVVLMVHGGYGYNSVQNGTSYIQFNIGSIASSFGGFYYHIGQYYGCCSAEYVVASTTSIECYLRMPTYFRGSAQIIEGFGFTYNSSFSTSVSDPSGIDLSHVFPVLPTISAGNTIVQANNYSFYQKNSSGDSRNSNKRNSSNMLEIGDATQNTGIIFNEPTTASKGISLGAVSTLTISSGAITVTKSYHRVDTEGSAASDDLDTINGGFDGQILVLRTYTGSHDVVVKNNTGNIYCGSDRTLSIIYDTITLLYMADESKWIMLSFADNA